MNDTGVGERQVSGLRWRDSTALHIGLILFVGFLIYVSSWDGPFLWDDYAFVTQNTHISDLSRLPRIFLERTGLGAGVDMYVYRPLQVLTYALDRSFWGLNPVGYHITNTFLHVLAALGVYGLISLLFGRKPLALLTALFFVVYPGHTQAVAYISARSESLSALFMLLCFILYIKHVHVKRGLFLAGALVSYALALLSKENALILPVLLFMYHRAFKIKVSLKSFSPFLVLLFLYIGLRMRMLSVLCQGVDVLLKRVPGFFVAMTHYLRLLILPVDLHVDHGNMTFPLTEARVWFGLAAVLALLVYAWRAREKNGLACFGVGWFFIALLPTTGIYPIPVFYMAEHWLYVPSIGFFVILADRLLAWHRGRRTALLACVLTTCLLLGHAYLTVRQNAVWRDPFVLYTRMLRYNPGSFFAHNNLGMEYFKVGEKEKALECFQGALRADPRMAVVHYNLGRVYLDKGEYAPALAGFKEAVRLRPSDACAHSDLCYVYLRLGKDEEAVASCRKAIESAPSSFQPYYFIEEIYHRRGETQKALEAGRRALALDPRHVEAYNNLASTYAEIGALDEAIIVLNEAVRVDPDFATGHFNLAVFYFHQGAFDMALRHCDRVVALGHVVDPAFLEKLRPHRK